MISSCLFVESVEGQLFDLCMKDAHQSSDQKLLLWAVSRRSFWFLLELLEYMQQVRLPEYTRYLLRELLEKLKYGRFRRVPQYVCERLVDYVLLFPYPWYHREQAQKDAQVLLLYRAHQLILVINYRLHEEHKQGMVLYVFLLYCTSINNELILQFLNQKNTDRAARFDALGSPSSFHSKPCLYDFRFMIICL